MNQGTKPTSVGVPLAHAADPLHSALPRSIWFPFFCAWGLIKGVQPARAKQQ